MPPKYKNVFVCSNCGFETPKWYGKCPDCGEWNTFAEEVKELIPVGTSAAKASRAQGGFGISNGPAADVFSLDEINMEREHRYLTGLSELDRVLGGGIVRGSLILLGGDPGIGKSTILLQICQFLGDENLKILYISAEESRYQVKLRAKRLGVSSPNLLLVSHTDIDVIMRTIQAQHPDVVIVDSIQTVSTSALNSSCGSVSQVRECTNLLARLAKSEDISIFVVGHVNKDGAIAGPKVLEHIVDAVLYFEGERNLSYRILRAVKNRYGSTNEIGVFEMKDTGLEQVENPSLMLLAGRPENVSGTSVACVMEGSRPILAEVQALATKTGFGTPRRNATGYDYNRMSLILAVLEKRMGYFFGNLDAYINIIGGLKLDDPSSDLPVALSLLSCLTDICIPEDVVSFGEIGLAGELRSVSHITQRIQEVIRLGFHTCILPEQCIEAVPASIQKQICLVGAKTIAQAFGAVRKQAPEHRTNSVQK